MTQAEEITGSEPASEMNIAQKATLDFMVALAVLPRQNAREVAQDAKRLVDAYILTCNDTDWNPGGQ